MLKYAPILNELTPAGFQLAFEDRQTLEWVLVRPRSDALFERVSVVHADGGTRAATGVEVAVVPGWTAVKGLVIHRWLFDGATHDGGWTTIADAEAERAMSARIASVAPAACAELAVETGPGLLAATAAARTAARRYVDLSRRHGRDTLRELVPASVEAIVTRVVSQRVVCIPGAHSHYEIAIMAIAAFCGEVEQEDGWLDSRLDSNEVDRELMSRLQIIASQLYGEPGWESQR